MIKKSKADVKNTGSKNAENEFVYDEITGARNKKTALSVLNKRVLGDYEMDELFCDWG